MRHYVRLLFGLIAIALALPGGAEDGKVGVVLLHGKKGIVPGPVGSLAQKLKGAGYLVATPEMPWSRNRIYGASYEDAMLEIDRAVEGLKKRALKESSLEAIASVEMRQSVTRRDGAIWPGLSCSLRARIPSCRGGGKDSHQASRMRRRWWPQAMKTPSKASPISILARLSTLRPARRTISAISIPTARL